MTMRRGRARNRRGARLVAAVVGVAAVAPHSPSVGGAAAAAAFAPLLTRRTGPAPAPNDRRFPSSSSSSARRRYSPDPGDPDMVVLDDPPSAGGAATSPPSSPSSRGGGAFLSGAGDDALTSNRPLSGIATGTFEPPSDPEELRLPDRDEAMRQPPPLRWDVYVCQSKPCRERGSGATLDAFVGLGPPDVVTVHPAVLSRAKGKGPIVRCIAREDSVEDKEEGKARDGGAGKGGGAKIRAFEVQNVDSVDKVYRILTKHMDIEGVDSSAAECLKHNYEGNAHLEKGEISEAIESYDRAIQTGYADQEGVVLLMRATAYLKRAFRHQRELKRVVSELAETVPDPGRVDALYGLAGDNPSLAPAVFRRVASDCRSQDRRFRRVKYRHGLYEFALLNAARDSLRSTQLLPRYAKTWLRAGDSLAELRKLKESAQYYERAMELDPTLEGTLRPVIERLKRSQDFLDRARADGWSEDTLRLALDVAG